jgi:hypothetical protein
MLENMHELCFYPAVDPLRVAFFARFIFDKRSMLLYAFADLLNDS